MGHPETTRAAAKSRVEKPRLDVLTTLRFFAAVQVVVFHCGKNALAGSPFWVRGVFQNGHQAVIFFFMLSGFVLTYSYYREEAESGLRSSKRDFWIARVARIYPVYALALVISIVPYVHSTFFAHSSMPRFIGGLLCVPLMLQAWIPQISWEWNMPAWSLSVETFFYLLFPWLAKKFLRNTSPKGALLWSSCFAFIVALCVYQFSQLPDMKWEVVSDVKYKFLMVFPVWHLPTFLFGMTLGRLFMVERSRMIGDKTFVAVGVVLLVIFALQDRISPIFVSTLGLTALFGLLIFSAANCHGIMQKTLGRPWLIFFGEASYGIYILHLPLYYWCSRVWIKAFGDPPGLNGTYFFVYLAFTLLFCCLTFVWFETPARFAVTGYLKNAQKKTTTSGKPETIVV